MSRTVYRYVVPVDDEWHTIAISGAIVHVDSRRVDAVEVWALHDDSLPTVDRAFIVVGTGHPLPDDAGQYIGSAIVADGALVWHLFGRAS